MRWGIGGSLAAGLLGCVLVFAPPAAAKRNVYVAAAPITVGGGAGAGQVAALDLGVDGRLTPTSGSPFAASQGTAAVALTPDGRLLYAVNSSAATVSGFSVAGTGRLNALAGIPAATGESPRGLAISPSGRHLYVANSESDTVSAFAINGDGGLTAIGSPAAVGNAPSGLAMTPDGSHLYVANQTAGTISSFAVDADGGLTSLEPRAGTAVGAQGLALTSDRRRLYVGSTQGGLLGTQGRVVGFAIADNGTLSPLPGSPYGAGSSAGPVAISADGRHLFTANPTANQVFSFTIAGDGSLQTAPGSPAATPARPRGLAVSPNGVGLFVGGDNGNLVSPNAQVATFAVAGDGSLRGVQGSPFGAGVPGQAGMFGLAVSPNQAPNAAFKFSARRRGTIKFDAQDSADPDGAVARYDWDFGDGTTLVDGGPTPTHAYGELQNYTVTLVVSDGEGCSLLPLYTGQTASCTGGAQALTQRRLDFDPPEVIVSARHRQPADAAVEVAVRCDEPCEATGKGKLFLFINSRGSAAARNARTVRELRLRPASVEVPKDQTSVLRLRIPPRGRDLARTALARGGKATATINVLAADGAGNAVNEPIRVRLARGS